MIAASAVVKDVSETGQQEKMRLHTYDPPRLENERNVSILINAMN